MRGYTCRFLLFFLLAASGCAGVGANMDVEGSAGSYRKYKERHPVSLWPLLEIEKSRDLKTTTTTGLFWLFGATTGPDESAFHFFPFFFAKASEEKSHTYVPPLFFYTRRKDDYWLHVPPVFWSMTGSRESWSVVFPFFWSFQRDEDREAYILPFYAFRSSPDGESMHSVLWPLFRYETSEKKETVKARFPLTVNSYDHDNRTNTGEFHAGRVQGVWDTFGVKSSPEETTVKLGSFFEQDFLSLLRVSCAEESTTVSMFPFYYYSRDCASDVTHHHLWPMFGYDRWVDKTMYSVAFPFFFHYTEPKITQAGFLWPLGMYEQTPTIRHARFFPLFWHTAKWFTWKGKRYAEDGKESVPDEVYTLFFPFLQYSRTQDKKTLTVMPFYYSFENRKGERSKKILLTLFTYYANKNEDVERFAFFDPLLCLEYRKDYTSFHLLPLIFHGHLAGEKWKDAPDGTELSHTVVFPFYWDFRYKGEFYLHTPLFGYSEWKDGNFWHFMLPLLWHREDASQGLDEWHALYPLFASIREGRKHTTRALPFYWHYRNREPNPGPDDLLEGRVVFPLYWSYRWKDSGFTGLMPFFWKYTKKDFLHYSVLLNAFFYTRDDMKNHTEVGVLWPLFQHIETPRRTWTHILPVYFSERSRGVHGEEGATVVFPFFWDFFRPHDRTTCVFPFFWHSKRGDHFSHTNILGIFADWKSDSEKKTSSGSVLSPLVMWGSTENSSYFHLAPFLWTWAEENRSSTLLVPPLFYRHKDVEADSLHWWALWPLADYQSNGNESDFSVLWQLMTYHSEVDGDWDFRVLYKFLEFKKEKGTTVYAFRPVIPLFKYVEEEDWYMFEVLQSFVGFVNDNGEKKLTLLWVIPIRWGEKRQKAHDKLGP